VKYHLLEHESYRELLKVREEVKNQYLKQEKGLVDRKERLFKSRDYAKWGYLGENGISDMEKVQDRLATNKPAAFTYMLQKETKELEIAKEELAFYSNQCLDETRRVGKDNGKLLIEHFIQMSQTQCSYINSTHMMWADFLSQFQEEAEGASPYEADVGLGQANQDFPSVIGPQGANPVTPALATTTRHNPQPQPPSHEESKASEPANHTTIQPKKRKLNDVGDGGSGGTSKIVDAEEEDGQLPPQRRKNPPTKAAYTNEDGDEERSEDNTTFDNQPSRDDGLAGEPDDFLGDLGKR